MKKKVDTRKGGKKCHNIYLYPAYIYFLENKEAKKWVKNESKYNSV
jgi:hypothetical protein